MPPLRARREDILDLAQGCLERHAGPGRPCRMSAAALEALLTYEWPGNVRELERVIERAITLAEGDEIQLGDLPPALNERYSIVQPATEGGESMRAWGSRYARLVLERCDNNKRQACRVLDISYHTLQAYLRYTPRLKATQRALPPPAKEDVPESAATADIGVVTQLPTRRQLMSGRRFPSSRRALSPNDGAGRVVDVAARARLRAPATAGIYRLGDGGRWRPMGGGVCVRLSGRAFVVSTARVLASSGQPLWLGRRGAVVPLVGAAVLASGSGAPPQIATLDAAFPAKSPAKTPMPSPAEEYRRRGLGHETHLVFAVLGIQECLGAGVA